MGLYNRHGTLPIPLPTSVPADSLGSPIADYSYAYSLDGKKSQEIRTGGGLSSETTTFQYDRLGRLSQVTLPDGTNRSYSYDLDSNRTSIIENGSTVSTYTYNPSVTPGIDQLTTVSAGATTNYGYTSDGQVSTRGSDSLSWDGWGRHTGGTFAGSTVAYAFDAMGFRKQRASGSATTRYLDGGLFETDAGGTITLSDVDGAAPESDLAHYVGPPTTSSSVSFDYYNGHGDLAAEADALGSRTAAYTYDPFGALRSGTAPSNTTVERWVGSADKKLDTTTNLIEMGARPYDPATGRFLAIDPFEGGACNNYDYVCQDPLNLFDLTGTVAEEDPCWPPAEGCNPSTGQAAFAGGQHPDEGKGGTTPETPEERAQAEEAAGKELANEGNSILGNKHTVDQKRYDRWQAWWRTKSKYERKLYDRWGGIRPTKKN